MRLRNKVMSAGIAPCMTSLCEMISTNWRVESFSISASGMTCSRGGTSESGEAPELCGRTLFDLFTIRLYDTYAFAQIWSYKSGWAVHPIELVAPLVLAARAVARP